MGNRYGLAAVDAVKLIEKDKAITPREAWDKALANYYAITAAAFAKGCPREAFLGLCEEGMIRGVHSEDYTSSIDNKNYAIKAVKMIKEDHSLTNNLSRLWKLVTFPKDIKQNSQMSVVVELWKNGLIN